ncbi:MAG: hypothetical protein ACI8W7_000126 [Gammaproteobacteria bacterium]|jgi:hypothetical protein
MFAQWAVPQCLAAAAQVAERIKQMDNHCANGGANGGAIAVSPRRAIITQPGRSRVSM